MCVTRPGRWGNPFRTAAEYRRWVRGELLHADPPPTREEIRRELRGRDLACWCGPDAACHADVLLEIANEEND